MSASTLRIPRIPFLATAFASMLIAVWAGLIRLGWPLPGAFSAVHGPLIIGGFLGTLIALERAVARNEGWMYLAPLAGAMGAGALVAGAVPAAYAFMIAQAVIFAAVTTSISVRWPSAHALVGTGAALAWVTGMGLLAARFHVYQVVWWWGAFLVLTIAAERLEMSRLRTPPRLAVRTFIVLCVLLLGGCALDTAGGGSRWIGIALLGVGAWLLVFDVASRTVRMKGLPRFTALCLLTGYGWLCVAGLLLVVGGARTASGFWYDAVLHAVFLGFVISMIFGHAPIILPAVINRAIPFHRGLYVPLALLHATLAVRIGADLQSAYVVRQWAGLGNVVAILLFLMLAALGGALQGRARGSASSAGR